MPFCFAGFIRVFSLLIYVFVLGFVWIFVDLMNIEPLLGRFVGENKRHAMLIYVALVTLLTALAVPRQVCSFVGGYTFGVWEGTLLATLGTGFSCMLSFLYARFVGQEWLHRRFGHRLSAFNEFLCQSPFLLTLVVRIIPLGSNFLTNFLAGISRIPAVSFLGGSIIGFTVQNFIFALMGSGVYMDEGSNTLWSAMLYVVSLSMGYWVYIRYKKQKCSSEKD